MKLLFLSLLFSSTFLWANENKADYFSFTFENDVFLKDDGLYSNALFISWGYNELDALNKQNLPSWIAYLAQNSYLATQVDKHYAVSYQVGHLIQTAIDISVEELVEEDAPYVGLLGWQGEVFSYDASLMDQLSLTLGVVGPIAGGEFVQKAVHTVIGANKPQGWDNQIDNEFVFALQADRLWRISEFDLGKTELDFITEVRGAIGNLRSEVGTGIGLRWGQQLEHNFIASSAFPTQKFNRLNNSPCGWFFFANTSANYVANDIFINGNSFKDSHSVALKHWQYGVSAGLVANLYDWSVTYTLLYLSDQYEGQNEASRFGSVTLSYQFK